ncbi:ParA family protein [Candidatus Viridilinea mediisalina]|uniref:ParA family protein n=1 Tax=Candidatus Viridilinea mediisalina TaxID=2024553 RepID=UPI001C2CC370|nr:ParA family protein [Candidatus Viridilinea mediisalina]
MILTVGNTKGGVGKTTLALNIAIARALAGRDVLLVDGDEQGTASLFTELRVEQVGSAGYTAVNLQGAALRTQERRYERSAARDTRPRIATLHHRATQSLPQRRSSGQGGR